MTNDLTTLSTAELCERARILADEFRSIGKGTEFATATDGTADHLIELSRRLDALRWRDAGSPPEDREKVLLRHQVLGWGEGWYIAEDRIWFFIDHRCAFDHILSWLPLPTYQPEREVRE